MNPSNRFRHSGLLWAAAFLLVFAAACGAGNTTPAATGDGPENFSYGFDRGHGEQADRIRRLLRRPRRNPRPPIPTIVVRGNLERSREKFTQAKTGRVAFLGGSVTNLAWREMVMRYLLKKFPETKFDFLNAGLNGTPAELGAFRLEEDVFGRGPVDLLFLEFAVNGGSVEAMEGIVRHARALSPDIDIIQMHIAAKWFSDSLAGRRDPGRRERPRAGRRALREQLPSSIQGDLRPDEGGGLHLGRVCAGRSAPDRVRQHRLRRISSPASWKGCGAFRTRKPCRLPCRRR